MFNKIKDIRISKGMTQKQLADILNVSQNAIYNWENGKRDIKLETLQKIANALEVPLSKFLDNELLDATMDDEDFGTNQTVEILNKRANEIVKNPNLTKEEKSNMLGDLITSGQLIIQNNIDHATVAKKQLLSFYFDELNMNGQDKALEQVELLTKIPDFQKDTTSDMQILKREANNESDSDQD